MTKKFMQKNIKLSLELDDYLARHPELYDKIPDGAVLVITLKNDQKFNDDSIAIVRTHYKPKQTIIKAEKAEKAWSLSRIELARA